MSLENILNKIIEDARLEAGKIIQESEKKAKAIIEEAEKEANEEANLILKEADREGKLEAHRLMTQARLEGKLHILSLKRKLVDEVLELAFQKAEVEEVALKRTIILKDGQKEESFNQERLKDELRPKLENYIAEVLEI